MRRRKRKSRERDEKGEAGFQLERLTRRGKEVDEVQIADVTVSSQWDW